jgi:hypothetical protein
MGSTSFGLNRGLQNILDLRKLKIDQSCMGSARLEQECIVKLKFRKVVCLVCLFAAQSRMQPTVSLSKADCNREQGFIAFASSLSHHFGLAVTLLPGALVRPGVQLAVCTAEGGCICSNFERRV